MTKLQMKQALQKHNERAQALRGEKLVVSQYPWDHNPYLAHTPGANCFPVCTEGHKRVSA